MPDYRDELRAAHDRIVQLEAELRPKAPDPRAPGPRWGLILVLLLPPIALLSIAVGGLWLFRRAPPSPTPYVEVPAEHYIAPPPYLGMSWYSQPLIDPIFADVDTPSDGKNEIIGLAWETGHDDAPLNVVALDRTTQRARWHAGPYPAHWGSERIHLVRVGDRLVVTGSPEKLHILDIHTGHELREPLALDDEISHVCPVHDGTPRFLVSSGWTSESVRSINVETGEIAKAGPKASCTLYYPDRSCARGDATPAMPCTLDPDKAVDARAQKLPGFAKFWSTEILAEGETRIAAGFFDLPNDKSGEYAVAFDPKTKVPRWAKHLAADGDMPDRHSTRGLAPLVRTSNGHLYYLYESDAEPLPIRLVSRRVDTGEMEFNVVVPGSAEGSYISSLSFDGGQAFVILDQTVYAFDQGTGAMTLQMKSF